MRFVSRDSWSPFGKGGINGYTYLGQLLDKGTLIKHPKIDSLLAVRRYLIGYKSFPSLPARSNAGQPTYISKINYSELTN
ncbi:hypothetical protein [Pseudomonas sp. SDI]|uniref:hypothetical protein n=1 Tax=Pseudomonas sp. SDI TaxID=2170734 RepID=UPI00105805EF|nr:hypothetical protein [Pseudomonas sp. SDI]